MIEPAAVPSLLESASNIAFVRNKVPYIIKTGNYISERGTKAVVTIKFTSNYPVAKLLTLSWGINTASFISVISSAVLNDQAQFFPAKVSTDTFAFYGAKLKEWLENRFEISRDFVLTMTSTATSATITFTARNVGSAYTIAATSTAAGFTTAVVTAGVNDTFQLNYSLYLELWAESKLGLGDFALLVAQNLTPYKKGNDYVCYADVAAPLKSIVKPTLPLFGANVIAPADFNLVNYYLRAGDKYGAGIPTVRAVQTFASKLVAAAGLQFNHWNKTKSIGDYSASLKFLSWLGDSRFTRRDQLHYLYWLNNDGPLSLGFTLKTYYQGTLIETIVDPLGATSSLLNSVNIVPVGYEQLDLQTKTYAIDKYTIQITGARPDESNYAGPVCTFLIDDRRWLYNKYLLYSNGLGGFDTLHLHGATQKKSIINQGEANVSTLSDYQVVDGEALAFNKSEKPSFITGTGYKSIADIEKLRDLLLSEHVYEITPEGFLPVVVQAEETPIYNKVDDIYAISLSYTHAFTNRTYSEF